MHCTVQRSQLYILYNVCFAHCIPNTIFRPSSFRSVGRPILLFSTNVRFCDDSCVDSLTVRQLRYTATPSIERES